MYTEITIKNGKFFSSTGRLRATGPEQIVDEWAYQGYAHYTGKSKPKVFGKTIAQKTIKGQRVILIVGSFSFEFAGNKSHHNGIGNAPVKWARLQKAAAQKVAHKALLNDHAVDVETTREAIRAAGYRTDWTGTKNGVFGVRMSHPEGSGMFAPEWHIPVPAEVEIPAMMSLENFTRFCEDRR